MRVALDISSTKSDHRFRGIGFYTLNLWEQLKKISASDNALELVTFNKQIPTADIYHFPAFNPFFLSFPPTLINKSIVTIHDLIPIDYPQHFLPGFKGKLRWQIQKKMLKYFRAIITDSKSSARSIIRNTHVKENKIKTVYLAADAGFQKLKKNSKQINDTIARLKPPAKFILYTGDLNWNKNVMLLANTCVKLKIPLVVAGKQAINYEIDRKHPWNKQLVEFQDFADANRQLIIRYGFVDKDDLVSLYNLASCYIQPSIAEGFGLPILEAMACGCPVICSNTTSLPEIAGDSAIYFNPLDSNDLETKIKNTFQNFHGIDEHVKKGLLLSNKFSWEKTAIQTWQIYKSLI